MALHDRIQKIRGDLVAAGKEPVPRSLQGVTKERLAAVLSRIDLNTTDIVDAVFALLDDHQRSWFTNAPATAKFCDGATTAHIGCHVGILQRGRGKLDREGRDYWLKPLWQIGAIEKVYLDSVSKQFLPGHPIAKSSNSAYRLAPSFVNILRAPDDQWPTLLAYWTKEDAIRTRLETQAQIAEQSRNVVDTKHSDLIRAAVEFYSPAFLPGYQVLYVDESDGDRVSGKDRSRLAMAGIELLLSDSMPDVLLWHPDRDHLWVIEAVTSDGEVDCHKAQQLQALAVRSGKSGVGFTTVYATWRAAALRQARLKNIHVGTYIWIQEDPTKHLLVSTGTADTIEKV